MLVWGQWWDLEEDEKKKLKDWVEDDAEKSGLRKKKNTERKVMFKKRKAIISCS